MITKPFNESRAARIRQRRKAGLSRRYSTTDAVLDINDTVRHEHTNLPASRRKTLTLPIGVKPREKNAST